MKTLRLLVLTSSRMRFRAFLLLAGLLLGLLTLPVLAADSAGQDIDWFKLGMGLLGGLAMFLFGMEQMSEGLKAAAGDKLRDVLSRLTRNRVMGAVTGAFVTAVLNSSSVTTVLVVGFISAGFMTLVQSVGVIMGANIGSTFTAQIVAFNVTQYALVMVAIGFFMLFTAKQDKTRYYGAMLMGLGLVFYGMGVMGEAMTPLRSYQPFLDLMIRMENPLLGILVGAVFTGLVQSSAATTGIAIVMATEGLISLPAGIALAFGANIGTCVTAILAALGKPVEALRAATVHIIFNIAGVLLWVMFIPQLADFVAAISPASPELAGKARMAAEVPRQIANAHTVFNVANTLLFLGFTTYFARLAERLVPDRPEPEKIIIRPRYLDAELIEMPAMALEGVRLELGHMGPLTDRQSMEFQALMSATINLESLADVIETELVDIAEKFIDQEGEPSEATQLLLRDLADKVSQAIEDVIRSVRENDEKAAENVIAVKDEIRRIAEEFLVHQSQRMGVKEDRHLALVRLELELLDKLRQMYTLTKRIAKELVPDEVASKA
jgi:phosphate:Na+ symporter